MLILSSSNTATVYTYFMATRELVTAFGNNIFELDKFPYNFLSEEIEQNIFLVFLKLLNCSLHYSFYRN